VGKRAQDLPVPEVPGDEYGPLATSKRRIEVLSAGDGDELLDLRR
jgi:hypothetical protein